MIPRRSGFLLQVALLCSTLLAASASTSSSKINLNALDYRVYPRRTQEEAALIEWGHSAIISALDVSVAHFGPQTSQAALFEVETMPVLASPVNGVMRSDEDNSPLITKLENADDVEGNVVVMTNAGGELTGVQMAQIAQKSGAAAILVVNVDEANPDDIYRLPVEDGSETIDIPVVMMSYNSATVLTTATVTPEMAQEDVVNNGMPDRIRLYAGGDRPFFEDVIAADPPVYLIHNLLTDAECDHLIQQANVQLPTKADPLQLLQDPDNFVKSPRTMLWQGLWQSAGRKAIEERIEQATGFPADHFTDFVIDRLEPGSMWKAHFDTLDSTPGGLPMATMTVFLSDLPDTADPSSASVVYPSAKGGAVQVRPQRGLSVIHHNWNEQHEFETNSVHALMQYKGSGPPIYVARKYVVASPISNARRVALPLAAMVAGGRLPGFLSTLYDVLVDRFGNETGGMYFDKICVFVPVLLMLCVVQLVVGLIQKQMEPKRRAKAEDEEEKEEEEKTKGRNSKKND